MEFLGINEKGTIERCEDCIYKKRVEASAVIIKTPSKTCAWCKQSKPITNFGLYNNSADGHCAACKECIKKSMFDNSQRSAAQLKQILVKRDMKTNWDINDVAAVTSWSKSKIQKVITIGIKEKLFVPMDGRKQHRRFKIV